MRFFHGSSGSRAFQRVTDLYEELGKNQALWAVMTYPQYRDDQNIDQLFESGLSEIKLLMDRLEQLSINIEHGSCLDFGCGVGRLTNALGLYFDEVTGIDISSTMIKKAIQLKKHDHVRFLLNKRDDLGFLQSSTFDFVYSNKTIQHIPFPASKNYIQDFYRILKPGGVAVFLIHSCRHAPEGSARFKFRNWYMGVVRPFLKTLRGKPPVQIHPISTQNVREYVTSAGGEILHWETDTSYTRRRRGRLRTWYWTRKIP